MKEIYSKGAKMFRDEEKGQLSYSRIYSVNEDIEINDY